MADGTIQRHQLVLRDVIYRRLPEYLAENPGVPREVVASAMRHLRGEEDSSEDGRQLADGFLEYMQSRSVGGERSENPAVTQTEYERWQESPDARHRLTSAGARNHEYLRDYSMLRSVQTGAHAPESAGTVSKILGLIGSFVDSDTADLAMARMVGGDIGRATEALYWWDKSNPIQDAIEGRAPAWADPGLMGSRYAETSPTTLRGLVNSLGRTDNPIGSLTGVPGELVARGPVATAVGTLLTDGVDGAYLGTVGRSLEDLRNQNWVAQHTRRTTPIVPDRSPGLGLAAAQADQDASSYQANQTSATYPLVAERFGFARQFMSPLAEMGAELPADVLFDPSTAATMGAGSALKMGTTALKGIGKRTVLQGLLDSGMAGGKSAASYMAGIGKELPHEGAISTGMRVAGAPKDALESFSSTFRYMTTPARTNPNVRLPDGTEVEANDPHFHEAYSHGQAEHRRNMDTIRAGADAYRKRIERARAEALNPMLR
jgi:hypothetical protein